MTRQTLIAALNDYLTTLPPERDMVQRTLEFVLQHADCFERSLLEGHVTGSAMIVNEARTTTLLIHHAKLNRWLQPGGHCDGDPDCLHVAIKEATEETGLTVRPATGHILDVDIHLIPERGNIPAHYHYDVRYLLMADDTQTASLATREVKDARWIPLDEVANYNNEESVMRMVRKVQHQQLWAQTNA